MAEVNQSEVISLILEKNERGLSLLYDNYGASLFGIVSRIVKNNQIAEEVIQNVFLKVWNNIESFNLAKGTLFTWMATIARRAALDQVKLKGYQVFAQSEDIMDNPEYDTVVIDTDKGDVQRLLDKLDQKNKVVLDLIYLQGNTQRDVAKILDIPLGTVKSRLRIAISSLRKELKSEEKWFLGALLILTLLNFVI